MPKYALFAALLAVAASPTLAIAKTVHHHHHHAAAAPAPAPEPTIEELNVGAMRMWHDLFMAPAYMLTGTAPHYEQ